MVGTGFLPVPILSGSAAYALKEFFGLKGDLGSKPAHRPTFYGVIGAAAVARVVFNFLHIDRIRALFYAAVINGLVAPPLMLQIVICAADTDKYRQPVSWGRLHSPADYADSCAGMS